MNQVPYLFLSCEIWDNYHQASDTPDRLNYAKIEGISRYLAALTQAISEPCLSGPFEGYDSTETEAAYIKKVLYPVMADMGLPMNVERRRDIDRLVNMMVEQLGS